MSNELKHFIKKKLSSGVYTDWTFVNISSFGMLVTAVLFGEAGIYTLIIVCIIVLIVFIVQDRKDKKGQDTPVNDQ